MAKKSRTSAISERMTKSQVLSHIAEATDLTKKDVNAVLEEFKSIITRSLKPRGIGSFTWSGFAKFKSVRKAATKARKGINPFTGEPTTFKAKPAHTVVRARALKGLKEGIQ